MFATLDVAAGVPQNRQKTACDLCKQKKVRCDMAIPCKTCTGRNLECTFNEARKKRGPASSRFAKLQRRRSKTSPGESVLEFTTMAQGVSLVSRNAGLSPSSTHDEVANHRASTASSNDLAMIASNTSPVEYWASAVTPYPLPTTSTGTNHDWIPNDEIQGTRALSTSIPVSQQTLDAPEFLLPSLPVESPTDDTFNLFAAIQEQDLSPIIEAVEIWPKTISQEALLPWIDIYFKRLHPTVPVLSRTMIYQEMLLRTHHHDPQFGAMLLALCAFAMTQPVQIHEVASTPSRSVQARMLLEESIKMRMTVDFGENPSVYMILTSFFIFACLFGNGQHKAAHHRLREAVDLANSLSMHLPQAYDSLDLETREQWLRTYLVLSVTESPAVNAYFMRAFGSSASSMNQDQTDTIGMTGLLYLMETFDAIDESVVECWAGYCKYSDGRCETFDRRQAIRMFRAQRRAREACLIGCLSFEPSTSLSPLQQLLESQQADISVTQFWLTNRLWELCMSHGLLLDSSDHAELRFDFAYHVANELLSVCEFLNLASMEVHGVGLIEKVYDIAMSLVKAMNSSAQMTLDSSFPKLEILTDESADSRPTVQVLLRRLHELIHNFRGGDHEYATKIAMVLNNIPEYNAPVQESEQLLATSR
ncbi:unnamed protein product, partial [Aureobasidium vineae]